LENVLSSNIVKPEKLIGQKQTSNLLKNTEQYRDSTKPVGQISKDQRDNPIGDQMERVKTTDY